MHITLRQIEVFTEVLKSGSTTQASQVLSLSQSAVSAALADLENQLGVQLFDRVGKRLVLNEHDVCSTRAPLACLSRRAKSSSCSKRTRVPSASMPAAPSATICCRA